MERKARLEIELCSDLCVASGTTYAGIVDQDIVYDELGLPYIPARRLKGCMREAAELIGSSMVQVLFGERGEGLSGCVVIENAVMSDSESFRVEIKRAAEDQLLKNYFSPVEVLNQFTYLRRQTKIDETTGTAEDNSLRVTRVVRQYHPVNLDESLRFLADIYVSAESETDCEKMMQELGRIAKATRHIGMHRNRGLGSVRCTLKAGMDKASAAGEKIKGKEWGDGTVKLTYCLENTEPLILSATDKSNTESCISGKSILGALAAAYLQDHPADTEEFADLFLNGCVKYANANLEVSGQRGWIAPLYINRLKKSGEYVNMLFKSDNQEDKIRDGNQPKKLKTQYVSCKESKESKEHLVYAVEEPQRELVYHHRHAHGTDNPEALFYSVQALKKGQHFIGEIYTDEAHEQQVRQLLKSATFRFGKSKTAQYGRCILCSVPENALNQTACETKTYDKNGKMVVTFKSDAIFINDADCYTVKFDEVKRLVAEQLGITYTEDEQEDLSIIDTTEITGYHTLWKAKRAAVPAVRAGSVLVYNFSGVYPKEVDFVGERTHEGFGEVMICPSSVMKYYVETEQKKELSDKSLGDGKPVGLMDESRSLLQKILEQHLVDELIDTDLKKGLETKLTASGIGRVTLMYQESIDRNATMDEIAADLYQRIDSIKTKSVKEEAFRQVAIKKLEIPLPDVNGLYEKLSQDAKTMLDIYFPEEKNELMKNVWREYMHKKLALIKYRKKGE